MDHTRKNADVQAAFGKSLQNRESFNRESFKGKSFGRPPQRSQIHADRRPMTQVAECRWGNECRTRGGCPYAHPSVAPCPFRGSCNKPDCKFRHPDPNRVRQFHKVHHRDEHCDEIVKSAIQPELVPLSNLLRELESIAGNEESKSVMVTTSRGPISTSQMALQAREHVRASIEQLVADIRQYFGTTSAVTDGLSGGPKSDMKQDMSVGAEPLELKSA